MPHVIESSGRHFALTVASCVTAVLLPGELGGRLQSCVSASAQEWRLSSPAPGHSSGHRALGLATRTGAFCW